MADTTVADAADELYGIGPSAFIAARTALAASAADRETATLIKALRKPPTSAWIVNLLARREPADVARLGTLAAELREAQDDRDAPRLTELNRARRMLVAELVRTATALADGEGVGAGAGIVAEVERTLGAAARDEAAAAAVRTGRLVRPLEASGVDPVDLTDAVAGEPPVGGEPESARGRDDLARRRARRDAERAVAAARREAQDAERDLARAESRLEGAREREAALRERVDGLERELERVRSHAEEAAAERRAAERALRDGEKRLRAAERAAAAADETAREVAAHGDRIEPSPSVEA